MNCFLLSSYKCFIHVQMFECAWFFFLFRIVKKNIFTDARKEKKQEVSVNRCVYI